MSEKFNFFRTTRAFIHSNVKTLTTLLAH